MRTNAQARCLLLLLVTTSSWATDHRVVVGGTSGGGGYGGGPILMFSPQNLTIAIGDTVTFTNAGGAPHNVHADNDSFRCAEGCDGDGHGGNGTPSAASWTSTVAFNQSGSFGYHCDIHGTLGMTGTVVVQEASVPGNVPITAGFTGAWFDPSQSGQGIFLEVLPGNVLLAAWYTFTPDGTQQAWFLGTGSISNDTAVVDASLTTGGAWIPNFDPSLIVNNPWGTLTFTFTDCTHGRVDFTSIYGNYGTNHMDLTRLTEPLGITCP
ncbi:MAG: plastocyanin/azurin family copper-binding protein [Rhodanobacteraceae bacterium]